MLDFLARLNFGLSKAPLGRAGTGDCSWRGLGLLGRLARPTNHQSNATYGGRSWRATGGSGAPERPGSGMTLPFGHPETAQSLDESTPPPAIFDIWRTSETNMNGGTSFQEIRESSGSQEKAGDNFRRVILSTSLPVCKSLKV